MTATPRTPPGHALPGSSSPIIREVGGPASPTGGRIPPRHPACAADRMRPAAPNFTTSPSAAPRRTNTPELVARRHLGHGTHSDTRRGPHPLTSTDTAHRGRGDVLGHGLRWPTRPGSTAPKRLTASNTTSSSTAALSSSPPCVTLATCRIAPPSPSCYATLTASHRPSPTSARQRIHRHDRYPCRHQRRGRRRHRVRPNPHVDSLSSQDVGWSNTPTARSTTADACTTTARSPSPPTKKAFFHPQPNRAPIDDFDRGRIRHALGVISIVRAKLLFRCGWLL